MMNLFYVVSFMLSTLLCSNDDSIKIYITLSNSNKTDHINVEFQIFIWEIVKSSLKDTNKICKDIFDHIKNTERLTDIVLNCITTALNDYSSKQDMITKFHFIALSNLIITQFDKKDGIYFSEFNNLITDLQSRIQIAANDVEIHIECFHFFVKAIKNIGKLVDYKYKYIINKLCQNKNYNKEYFLEFNTNDQNIHLKTLLLGHRFKLNELLDISANDIKKLISSILNEIKNKETNIDFYFDIRLENFYINFFEVILEQITTYIEKEFNLKVNEITDHIIIKLRNEIDTVIKKVFDTYFQIWNSYIFKNEIEIIDETWPVLNNITFNYLNYNDIHLFKLIEIYGLRKGVECKHILLITVQYFNAYSLLFKKRLVNLIKQEMTKKYETDVKSATGNETETKAEVKIDTKIDTNDKLKMDIELDTVTENDEEDIDETKLYNNITNLKYKYDHKLDAIEECDEEE